MTTPHHAAHSAPDTPTDADPMPPIRHLVIEGKPAVALPLSGKHGLGLTLLLDADDLERVTAVSPWWTVQILAGTRVVTSSTANALRLARAQSPTASLLVLARFLTAAPQGSVVTFANKNRMDHRKANLVVTARSEFSRHIVGHRWTADRRRAAEAALATIAGQEAA